MVNNIKSTNEEAKLVTDPEAIRLDLGCGDSKRSDYKPFIGIDRFPYSDVDIVRDIQKHGLPFSDCSVDFIFASHFMEHIDDLVFIMDECWRVLKRGGLLEIICPKWDTEFALYDPTHRRFIHPVLWRWWLPGNKEKLAYGAKAEFEIISNEITNDGSSDSCPVVVTAMKALKPPTNLQANLGVVSNSNIAVPLTNQRAIKIDLGCGDRKRNDFPPFIGIDSHKYSEVDIVRDVDNNGLPFGDYTVDFIYSSHFMEHVHNLIFVMEECWRVLKRRGILELICPKWDTHYAYAHPDHKKFIHTLLWDWWSPHNKEKESYGVKASFQLLRNYTQGEGVFTTMMKDV